MPIKDSGKKQEYASGFHRDTLDGKLDFLLVRDGPMYRRWTEHATAGAVKYGARNWMKAETEAELEHFRASAARHFEAWVAGEQDEDHASAVFWNINAAEHLKEVLVTRAVERAERALLRRRSATGGSPHRASPDTDRNPYIGGPGE